MLEPSSGCLNLVKKFMRILKANQASHLKFYKRITVCHIETSHSQKNRDHQKKSPDFFCFLFGLQKTGFSMDFLGRLLGGALLHQGLRTLCALHGRPTVGSQVLHWDRINKKDQV